MGVAVAIGIEGEGGIEGVFGLAVELVVGLAVGRESAVEGGVEIGVEGEGEVEMGVETEIEGAFGFAVERGVVVVVALGPAYAFGSRWITSRGVLNPSQMDSMRA